MVKVYNSKNVWDAALDRIRRIYDEFENVYIGSSGGKDSTIITELAIIVAKEKGRLPIDVCFCDQESEYQATVDYFRKIQNRPEIRLHWFQVPFQLNNSTTLSDDNLWMKCWNESEKDKWVRPHEPNAITDIGKPDTIDFYEVCDYMGKYVFGEDSKFAVITGITAEESLNRYTLIHKENPVYKDMYYCSRMRNAEGCYRFYPIYDWKVYDVWHAIAKNKWLYNTTYDKMFQMGVSGRNMRVSSIIHETGVHALKQLKEIEPKTFEKLTQRIGGINTYHMLFAEDMFAVKKLPVMFSSWIEYRYYLMEHIISEKQRPILAKQLKGRNTEEFAKEDVKSILLNDVCGTKNHNSRRVNEIKTRYKEH